MATPLASLVLLWRSPLDASVRRRLSGSGHDPGLHQRVGQGENSLGWSGPEKAPLSLQMLVLPLMPP
jgi:hypothetical protein